MRDLGENDPLEFSNDPGLVEQCRIGVRILQYRNRNTDVSEEMRRILANQLPPQRRHTDVVPFTTIWKPNK